mmetsp:Transcript_2356/g.7160  ORF Transcript_2356/g.7160 Transcript_2356/m.7160 type:complete len:119 (-) Transcript_2356:1731-2087(-)
MLARAWFQPSLSFHSISTGCDNEAMRTVIPSKPLARLSVRYPIGVDHELVSKAVTQQFFRGANIMNTACEIKLNAQTHWPAWEVDRETPLYQASVDSSSSLCLSHPPPLLRLSPIPCG